MKWGKTWTQTQGAHTSKKNTNAHKRKRQDTKKKDKHPRVENK